MTKFPYSTTLRKLHPVLSSKTSSTKRRFAFSSTLALVMLAFTSVEASVPTTLTSGPRNTSRRATEPVQRYYDNLLLCESEICLPSGSVVTCFGRKPKPPDLGAPNCSTVYAPSGYTFNVTDFQCREDPSTSPPKMVCVIAYRLYRDTSGDSEENLPIFDQLSSEGNIILLAVVCLISVFFICIVVVCSSCFLTGAYVI